MSRKFEVIVGNIGVVFTSGSHQKAAAEYNEWVNNSQLGIGRASGEPVTLTENGEPIREYEGES